MVPLLPLPPTAVLSLVAAALAAAGLAIARPAGRAGRFAWCALACAVVTIVAGMVLWSTGALGLAGLGVRLVWTTLVVLVATVAALGAVSGVRLAAWVTRRLARSERDEPRDPSRRALLAAGLPAVAACSAGGGFVGADGPPRVPVVPVDVAGLPPELAGLRILHLSDLHLGIARRAADVEALLERLASDRPDLVVLTGDVADDPDELGPALAHVTRFAPRLGAFACLGNHEYLAGVATMRRIFERSGVTLLVDRGVTIDVGSARLFVGGADDPLGGRVGHRESLERSVAKAAHRAPAGAFKLLLCHRPDGLDAAARAGFDLVLAGHLHGGQIGLLGTSLLDWLAPGARAWGLYRRDATTLYTSAGFGHWFPFRFGCPTEAPVIVLREG